MHTSERKPVDPNAKFEKEDISLAAAKKGVIIFFIFTAAHYPLVWLFTKLSFDFTGKGRDTSVYFGTTANQPITVGDESNRRIPVRPAPLLQDNITATADMRNHIIDEREKLETDGVDPKTGIRKMPIEKAIEMEAQRGGQ